MLASIEGISVWAAAAGIVGAPTLHIVFKLIAQKLHDSFYSSWDGALLVILERFPFVFAICFGYLNFPILWIGLKVGVQSKTWTDDEDRTLLNVYLIMNLISAFIAYLCAWAALGFPESADIAHLIAGDKK